MILNIMTVTQGMPREHNDITDPLSAVESTFESRSRVVFPGDDVEKLCSLLDMLYSNVISKGNQTD